MALFHVPEEDVMALFLALLVSLVRNHALLHNRLYDSLGLEAESPAGFQEHSD